MTSDSASSSDENDPANRADADSTDAAPDSDQEAENDEVYATPPEIRLAKVSVTRTGHGVAMDIMAGKLRLRLYIDAQWSSLVQTIAAGEGELDQFIPFRMAPLEMEGDTGQLTPETLEARRIPELSSEHPLFGTPLWNAIFPSGEPPAKGVEFDFDDENAPDDSSDEGPA